jgi:pyruvate dehydrogenase E1 component
VETLLQDLPPHCHLVTVIDGHPATLAWMGGVCGHRTIPLGVEHFGQTGTIAELYRHFGISAESIVEKVAGLTAGRPPARAAE